jgi:hypothetical protein
MNNLCINCINCKTKEENIYCIFNKFNKIDDNLSYEDIIILISTDFDCEDYEYAGDTDE